MGNSFTTTTESGTTYESKTVILAVGVQSAGKIEGEEEFVGRGVSYCATCDGALYKGKTIAVLSTSKHFEGEVEFLSKLAEKLYFIPLYKNPQVEGENVVKMMKVPQKIVGDKKVQELVMKDGALPVDGIFMLKESVPPTALVFGIEQERGHVRVERDMSTNLKGLYAAGDCTGRPYQYAKAVGEGNVAAHSVIEYIRKKD
jgi:thioredoxin reductase (NADPH)